MEPFSDRLVQIKATGLPRGTCKGGRLMERGGLERGSAERRIGVVGIVITDREKSARRVNEILSAYGEIIVGRMGIPYREKGLAVMALIVDGTTDAIGAMTGKLGAIAGVVVRSAVTPVIREE